MNAAVRLSGQIIAGLNRLEQTRFVRGDVLALSAFWCAAWWLFSRPTSAWPMGCWLAFALRRDRTDNIDTLKAGAVTLALQVGGHLVGRLVWGTP